LQELPELAKSFKIYYKKVDGKTPTSYTLDHTAGSYVYDTQGRVRLFTRYGTGAQPLAQDIALLLKEQ
jgi:protein SCO1/2